MSILEVLTNLSKKHDGHLTPQIVLREAEKKTSPLHTHFEWDDSVAAERWRLEQAGQLIRKVRVTITNENTQKEMRVRAFFHVHEQEEKDADEEEPQSNTGMYVPVKVAMENYSEQVKAAALAELKAIRNKWAQVEELSKIWKQIDDL